MHTLTYFLSSANISISGIFCKETAFVLQIIEVQLHQRNKTVLLQCLNRINRTRILDRYYYLYCFSTIGFEPPRLRRRIQARPTAQDPHTI